MGDPGAVLRRAEASNAQAGHENRGPSSGRRGFVPAVGPAVALGEPAWDDVVAQLPQHYAHLTLRAALQDLPPLDVDALPDSALQGAATATGILVHAHHRVEPRRETPTPPALADGWRQVSLRRGPGAVRPALLSLLFRQRTLPFLACGAQCLGRRWS